MAQKRKRQQRKGGAGYKRERLKFSEKIDLRSENKWRGIKRVS